MFIGLDLDNTIICYDGVFHRVARRRGWIEDGVEATKKSVKLAVLAAHGNDVWTELQAEVYGPALSEASEYEGARAFAETALEAGLSVAILSHKTRYPALGLRSDLHSAALAWLESCGWIDLIGRDNVEFHETRSDKVAAIARRGCRVFVDDLPEVFAEPGFPHATRKILFDPDGVYAGHYELPRSESWGAIRQAVFGGKDAEKGVS